MRDYSDLENYWRSPSLFKRMFDRVGVVLSSAIATSLLAACLNSAIVYFQIGKTPPGTSIRLIATFGIEVLVSVIALGVNLAAVMYLLSRGRRLLAIAMLGLAFLMPAAALDAGISTENAIVKAHHLVEED